MGKPSTLSVKIVADVSDAKRGLDQISDATDKVEGKFSRFNSTMDKLKGPAALAATGMLYAAKNATAAASALQQSTGSMESTFGAHAGIMKQHAAEASMNLGLAKNDYQQLATLIGSQLKNMGVPTDQLAGQTHQLMTTAADLAAQFGGPTSDAVDALSALLRGERDPIEKYGVSITQADLKAKKAALGLADMKGEAEKAANTTAVLALVTEQTGAAHGAFAREINTAEGAAQRADAAKKNLVATLGTLLLPAYTKLNQLVGDAAEFMNRHQAATLIVIGAIASLIGFILAYNVALHAIVAIQGTVAAASALPAAFTATTGAITGAITSAGAWIATTTTAIATTVAHGVAQAASTTATFAATAAQWAWNVATAAWPGMLIVVAIAAIIAAIVWMILHWDKVKAAGEAAAALIKRGWQATADGVAAAWGWCMDKLAAGWNWLKSLVTGVGDAIGNAFKWAFDKAIGAWNFFWSPIRSGLDWMGSKISWVKGLIAGLHFPSPPAWLSKLGFSDVTGGTLQLGTITAAAAPGLPWSPTAATAISPRMVSASTTIDIHVNGALDKRAVAHQIRDILNSDARISGRVGTGAEII